MAFSDLQLVDADDLNNFSPSGNVSIGGTLGVTGATTVAALTASGTVTPQGLIDASGASAGQLKFPSTQNASTNIYTLDDYRELITGGSPWTPIIGGTGGQSGQAYSSQIGCAIKLGKFVAAFFDVTLSTAGTITTAPMIGGLPATVGVSLPGGICTAWANLVSGVGMIGVEAVTGTTYATLTYTNNFVTDTLALTTGHIGNTTRLKGVVLYIASA
jgi:hypothetical protein